MLEYAPSVLQDAEDTGLAMMGPCAAADGLFPLAKAAVWCWR